MKTYVSVTSVFCVETPHGNQGPDLVKEMLGLMALQPVADKFHTGGRITEVASLRQVGPLDGDIRVITAALTAKVCADAEIRERMAPWAFVLGRQT